MKKAQTANRSGKPFSHLAVASEDDSTLVTVAAFPQAIEAHLLRSWLEADGLFCVLGNEYIALSESPIAAATGGIQVRVRAADVPRAQAIIRQFQTPPASPLAKSSRVGRTLRSKDTDSSHHMRIPRNGHIADAVFTT